MILILGNGFVGEALSRKMVENNEKVKVFSDTIGQIEGVEYRVGDWREIDQHIDFFDKVTTVVQTIHTTVPYTSMQDIYKDATDNILPHIKLLQILKEKNIKNGLFLSSGGAVYGFPQEKKVNEFHHTNPISAYGVSKLSIEKYIQLYNQQFNLNISIIRPSNLYGVGQNVKKPQGIIAHIITAIKNNIILDIWGTGTNYKDYLYIDDFIEALTLLVQKKLPNPQVYNIASGETYTVLELISIVEKLLDKTLQTKYLPPQSFDVLSITQDVSLFKKHYLWEARTTLVEGIRKIIKASY